MSLRGEGHGKTFASILVEVLLITVGVFLALWANNWHEEREHRAKARETLHNFVAEMKANEQATQANRAYHETLARELNQFLQSKELASEERFYREVHFEGVRPVIFEHTAWDLALATQALSYLPPDLAFDVSQVYTQQNAFQTLENSFLASAFSPVTLASDNSKGFATATLFYLIDVNQREPDIVRLYEKVLPEIKRTLAR